MPTIEERANKYAKEESGDNYVAAILRYGGYVRGATEQKQIDDREMSDALSIQRQMFFEKACNAFCANCEVGQAVCKEQRIRCTQYQGFCKAMEE